MELNNKILENAILFATEKHGGQIRKGDGRPYIMHPLSVMQTIYKFKKSKNIYLLLISAILHDCVEDCNTSIEEISLKFGFKVASIVEELTTNKKDLELIGKKQYLLNKMKNMSTYALCIKLCDRLDNINDLDNIPKEKVFVVIEETNFIIENLINDVKLTNTHLKIIKEIKKSIKKINVIYNN